MLIAACGRGSRGTTWSAVLERRGGSVTGAPWLDEPGTDPAVVRRSAAVGFPEGWPDLEVGGVVARPHWGNSYAPEAGRASMKWAQDELGADHVVSLIADDNERSARVAEKLGMAVEGRALILGEYDVRVFGRDLGSHRA